MFDNFCRVGRRASPSFLTLYVFLDRYVPEVGGRLVEPMDDTRLRRFLAARRHRIADAAALFAKHWKFRAETFGPRARKAGAVAERLREAFYVSVA